VRKIINNKRYDTETAIMVGERGHGYAGDFERVSETLYRTRRGNWFLHGEGGAMSSYARQCGPNEWIGSEKIVPLTEEEAFAWAQRALDAETVDAFFGDRVSDA
jgi:hypothetical protein